MSEPETLNRFMVSADDAGHILVLNPPLAPMPREHALNLAAWLIVLADPDAAVHMRAGPIGAGAEFVNLLRAIAST